MDFRAIEDELDRLENTGASSEQLSAFFNNALKKRTRRVSAYQQKRPTWIERIRGVISSRLTARRP